MSSILNSPIARPAAGRRRLLLALLAAPFAAVASTDPTTGLTRWGTGTFRRFGFLVYEATLWSGGEDPQRPPLALRLTYKRNIAGKAIADASVKEMRQLGVGDDRQLRLWGEQMERIFPDVKPEDQIVGLHLPQGARFFHNGRLIGAIGDPGFAEGFFAIWLDPKTSAPELRAALLRKS
ncbi:MAG: hypothetical protein CVU34_18730 [Betaproteobacteria bacterium HGW-Betaproteobacteria-7]|jgi:hypothetical protein|nr:MAG: hypothetical protein CVU34_18730 [Betaproteobacteria bacterium HGW-Betaproteobacteria-7]